MGSNIDIIGPATIALLGGTSLNSLDSLPPDGLTLTDSDAPTAVAVTLATSGASLSASSAGGASIASNGGTLTISGSLGAVNAALASLEISGTGGTLSIVASDNAGATSTTTLALAGYSNSPLAFVAPPGTFSAPLGEPNPLSGLTLAADGAVALDLLGVAAEAMNLTLISSNGPLLLDPASAPGIAISGDATGTLVLGFASSQLAAVNAALGAVDLVAGRSGTLEYIARELSGPLVGTVTSGSFTCSSGGTASSGSESWSGGSGSWQAGGSWSGGFTPNGGTGITISGTEVIGGIGVASALTLSGANVSLSADVAATGSLAVTGSTLDLAGSIGAPAALSAASADISGSNVLIENAALSVQGDLTFGTQASMLAGAAGTLDAGTYSLGGGDSLLDFGSLGGGVLAVGASAAALLPGGGALGDFVSVGGGGVVDFAGLLEGGATAVTANPLGFTLASGGIIEGAGTLVAGDFSEAGVIDGPGTILALGPAPLTIAAGSIGGGAQLVIDPGAVLELGAVSPLYGVFDPTPLTLDSSVTVSFAPGASAAQDQGSYASAPGEQGGVLVLDYPADFAGTIMNFAPGDRIVLPQLADLSISNLTGHSFVISGIDQSGISESDTIHASYASGLSPAVETDAAGDQVIGLRATTAQLTLNDTPATQAMIDAVSGYAETITGLGLLLPSAGSTALSLTISALSGLLGDGAGQASTLTLAGSSGLALNDLLDHLSYTPQSGGSGDTLRFAGGGGALTGFSANVAVSIAAAATLSWQGGSGSFGNGAAWSGGNAPANGDVAVFGSHAGAADIITGTGEASALTIAGAYDFAGSFVATGLGSAALSIDHQAVALFDANAAVSLGGSMLIGDAGGAGTLGIAGSLAAQSVDVAGNANATGSLLDVSGSFASAGAVQVGASAAGTLDLSGNLSAGQVTLGASGVLRGVGAATAGLGALDLEGGTLALSGGASASAGNGMVNGGTILLAGQSSLAIGQTLTMAAG
ncbi:MAG TPA: hypothetical protein VFN77_07285, partial [Acetobacteraceae bacterium]|nr:hypothetical protein [Acetobacteraceae bacterium]